MFSGGCRCGEVRYTIELDCLPGSYACHCLDCQTWSGSAFSQQIIVAAAIFTIGGALAIFELIGDSGRISLQRACTVCFTRIFNTNSGRPGMIVVRAGTLDTSSELGCVAHIWTRRKQPWLDLPGDVPTWPEAAESSALAACLDAAGSAAR